MRGFCLCVFVGFLWSAECCRFSVLPSLVALPGWQHPALRVFRAVITGSGLCTPLECCHHMVCVHPHFPEEQCYYRLAVCVHAFLTPAHWHPLVIRQNSDKNHNKNKTNKTKKINKKFGLRGVRTTTLCVPGLSPYATCYGASLTVGRAWEYIGLRYAYVFTGIGLVLNWLSINLCNNIISLILLMAAKTIQKFSRIETSKGNCCECKKEYCVINITHLNDRYKIKVNSRIGIYKLKKCIRKLLKWKYNEAMYVFYGDTLLGAGHLGSSCIEVTVVGEAVFGGESTANIDGDQQNITVNDDSEHVITCSYSNTDGSAYDKLMAIELETVGDRDFMATELNLKTDDSSILTNRLGAWAAVVDGSHYTYKKGKRVELQGRSKKSGYGTGIVSKDAGAIKIYESLAEEGDRHFEILALEVVLSDKCKEGSIEVPV